MATATTTALDLSMADTNIQMDKAPAVPITSANTPEKPLSTALPSIPTAMRSADNSMKSTWRTFAPEKWTATMKIYKGLGLFYNDPKKETPVNAKDARMPYVPHSEGHRWVLSHALWPLFLHQAYNLITGSPLPIWLAIPFYIFSFHFNAIHEIHKLRELGHIYGFLDGDKKRDDVPDSKVVDVLKSLGTTATVRPMVSVLFAYRSSTSPLGFTPWLPVEIGLYGIVLDFYYYWYHRVMHESDTLWKFHRTHHMTKHPTALLSLYADEAQEFFDVIGIPLLTYATLRLFGLPMSFADWWMCQQYVVFTELWGHSGLRIMITAPTPATPFLKLFDAELVTEDHDLHHRKGWKSSHNYGKQTRLWDRMFGTVHERYESIESNIDWNWPVALNWFH